MNVSPRGQERHREYMLHKWLGLGFVVEMIGHFGFCWRGALYGLLSCVTSFSKKLYMREA